MKILLRFFALILGLLGPALFLLFTLMLFRLQTDLSLIFAWLVSAALALLCVRVSRWLWSNQPFWKDRKKTAEVATAGTAFLSIAATAQLEKVTDGNLRTFVQITAVILVVAGYFVFRRFIPAAKEPGESSG
jgi:tellurite resistance protein TehA-like permease